MAGSYYVLNKKNSGFFFSLWTMRSAEWNFHAEGNQIKGTMVYKNRLYRLLI